MEHHKLVQLLKKVGKDMLSTCTIMLYMLNYTHNDYIKINFCMEKAQNDMYFGNEGKRSYTILCQAIRD